MKFLKYSSMLVKYLHPRQVQIFKKRNIFMTTPNPGIREWWGKPWFGSPPPPPPPKNIFQQFLELPPHLMFLATLFMSVLLFVPTIYIKTHIFETPITGRRRFLMFTPHQFDEITKALYKLYISEYRNEILPESRPEYTNVIRVTNALIKANDFIPEIRNKKWSVTILDLPHYNIVVFQSGHIFVYRGMLSICTVDDHLAAVLSHELAHAIMGHAAELTNKANFADKLWMMVLLTIWSILPSTPQSILDKIGKKLKGYFVTVPYTPIMEEEADKVAIKMAARACYDVRESGALWGKMEALENTYSIRLIDWLYIHPDRRRSERFDVLIKEAISIREASNCPKLDKHDPRSDLEKFRRELREEATAKYVGSKRDKDKLG